VPCRTPSRSRAWRCCRACCARIIRAFVRLRRAAATFAELGRRLDALERRYDERFRVVFQALRELMQPPARPRKAIGFRVGDCRGAGGRGVPARRADGATGRRRC